MECGTQTMEIKKAVTDTQDGGNGIGLFGTNNGTQGGVDGTDMAPFDVNSSVGPLGNMPILPPGFFLVHCQDRELELCTCILYVRVLVYLSIHPSNSLNANDII